MKPEEKKYLFGMEVATLASLAAGTMITVFAVGVSYSVLVEKVKAQEASNNRISERHSQDVTLVRADMRALKAEIKEELSDFRHEVKTDIKEISRDIKSLLKSR